MEIKKLIKEMTLIEKASMFSGKSQFTSFAVERLGIKQVNFADGPHGIRKQLGSSDHLGLNESAPATCFPPASCLSNSWDVDLVNKVGYALGIEAKHHDVQVLLGPGLNIKRHPRCGRNFEYYSEDPYLSGKLAAAQIKGIQATGTIACPKHLALNSQESKRMVSDSIVDERTKNEIYLTGFEIAVKEGQAKSIMSSYNKINGIYANEDRLLLIDILVDKWHFNGFVVSDWGGSNDHVLGLINSSHLEMPGTNINAPLEIIKAVNNGSLSERILDERLETLLNNFQNINQNNTESFNQTKHHQLAQEAARNSIVLLKNDNNILPFNNQGKTIIIGDFAFKPRYQGAGSSIIKPTEIDNMIELSKESNLNITSYAKGFNRDGSTNEMLEQEALELAKDAKYIIYMMGLPETSESEGVDRSSINLPNNQIALLEKLSLTKAKIIVVLSAGCVVDTSFTKYADAFIHCYLSGQGGALALLDIISGKTNPSGKLSESYPLQASDIIIDKIYPQAVNKTIYYEGIFVGYRYYDTNNIELAYPFGFGLSYSTFKYNNLVVSKDSVSFTITNISNVSGLEIAQLYIGKKDSQVPRAKKELKGFTKIKLEAQESKEIKINFDEYSFRHYNANLNEFVIEGGTYQIMIGSSSLDIHLEDEINVEATYPKLVNDSVYPNYFKGKISLDDEDYKIIYNQTLSFENLEVKRKLTTNDTLSDLKYAYNPLARLYGKQLQKMIDKSFNKGVPNLDLLFQSGMPFRAIAKMMNGNVDKEMVNDILLICNGHFFKGMYRLIKSYFRNKKRIKRGIEYASNK